MPASVTAVSFSPRTLSLFMLAMAAMPASVICLPETFRKLILGRSCSDSRAASVIGLSVRSMARRVLSCFKCEMASSPILVWPQRICSSAGNVESDANPALSSFARLSSRNFSVGIFFRLSKSAAVGLER